MLEINVSLWGYWDEMMDYVKEMQRIGMKIKLTEVSELFKIWHGEELEEIGFKAQTI